MSISMSTFGLSLVGFFSACLERARLACVCVKKIER